MNRFFIFIILLLFAGNINPISASFFPDSLQKNSDTVISDTVSQNREDSIITSENTGAALIGEDAQVIPRTQTFNFDLVRILRGLLGMLVLIAVAFLFSTNRKAISWKVVYVGLGIQLVLAICILWIPGVQTVFEFVGKIFVKIIDFTMEGTTYLFKSMETGKLESPLLSFVITILPTVIFFSAITSVLYYLRVIQVFVFGLAWLLTKALKITGAEGLSVAGNIFLGQTESPLMIKAYLDRMNKSQMLLVMAGGMATLAGGVLAVYINVLGGTDPVQKLIFAKHLLAASVMAAPGVIVISKVLIPQTDEVKTDIEVPKEKIGKNLLDAITIGTSEGLRLAVNVAAMLLVFIALIAMLNYIFFKVGAWTNLNDLIGNLTSGRYNELSLQFILGYSLSPLMWLIGVCSEDITLVGQLLGEKIIMTEFISYISLAEMKSAGAFHETKSIIMSTYILCGFANFASIGIQIGGIGALAPSQRILLSRLGLRALLAGTLASLLSATIIGMILG